MEPQNNAQKPADTNAADWNDEKTAVTADPSVAASPEVEVALNGGQPVPTGTPPMPVESTVGGPDAPSITGEAPVITADTQPGQSIQPDGMPSEPAGFNGQTTPEALGTAAVQPETELGTTSTDPVSPAVPDQSGAQPPLAASEPALHRPTSSVLVLVGLVVLVVAALAFFVLPMLF